MDIMHANLGAYPFSSDGAANGYAYAQMFENNAEFNSKLNLDNEFGVVSDNNFGHHNRYTKYFIGGVAIAILIFVTLIATI